MSTSVLERLSGILVSYFGVEAHEVSPKARVRDALAMLAAKDVHG